MLLSDKVINFILHIKSQGNITKKTQSLHAFQYYTMCWHLRDNNVLKENGLSKEGQKIWILTEKGNKLADLLIEVKRVLHGED